MPRPLTLGLLLLLLAASGLGLGFGHRVAGLDESAFIARVAREHQGAGGRAEECIGRPGTGRIWLVVTCGSGEGATVRAFDRWGFGVALKSGDGA